MNAVEDRTPSLFECWSPGTHQERAAGGVEGNLVRKEEHLSRVLSLDLIGAIRGRGSRLRGH